MIAAAAAAALIVSGSLLVGAAVLTLSGCRESISVAGPVGLVVLLAVAAIVAEAGGRATALAIALGAVTLAAAVVLVWPGRAAAGVGSRAARERRSGPRARWRRMPWAALAAVLLAALAAALPFIVAGRVGILGVGLVNDDMASHLLLADWLAERFRPEPVLIDQGYPLGPHAVVIGVGSLLGASTVDAFAGLVLAIPALTALVAYAALGGVRTPARVAVAALVALPYMATAYLAQEAFKEPILALFLLTFALLLPAAAGGRAIAAGRARAGAASGAVAPDRGTAGAARGPVAPDRGRVGAARAAIPLGLLAAGAVYVYSFPGLAWLAATAVVWIAIEAARGRAQAGRVLAAGAAALAVAVVAIAPELPRLIEFADFRALDPDRANEGGLGNLPGQISPLTVFGIWPTSEFRLAAGTGSLPAIVFYLGAVVGAAALALGLPRWVRRHGAGVPAGLAAAALLYLAARGFGTVYTSAKAIAIAAPLVTLIALGGLLARTPAAGLQRPRGGGGGVGPAAQPQSGEGRSTSRGTGARTGRASLAVLAAAVALGCAGSSFLVLRSAPVGPQNHGDELAAIRPLVAGQRLLFLGRDNFVLWELRGSRPFTHVRNFYDPYFIAPNPQLRKAAYKFDFDAVDAGDLARFPYVLTTRAAYASGPPPGYRPVMTTESYVLWERRGRASDRRPAERDEQPGRTLACGGGRGRGRGGEPAPGRAAVFTAPPVLAPAAAWSETTLHSGGEATISLRLPPGRWHLSLRYDATWPLTLRAAAPAGDRFEHTLPGNLDYRGVAPFWPAGTIDAGPHPSGPVQITATVERPPLAGRLLGADSVAHLGELAATPAAGGYIPGATAPYPGASQRLAGEGAGAGEGEGEEAGAGAGAGAACGHYADWLTR